MNKDQFFKPIPYVGSFQRGHVIRTGEPLAAAWRHIERCGTVENMARTAAVAKWSDPSKANVASLRMRQAVELRRASRDTSLLTRPLMLYYAMLNLTRAVMATPSGDFGDKSHGLGFVRADSLLECSAKVYERGTFPQFIATLGFKSDLTDKKLSLRDLLAQIPEMRADFPLLDRGHAAVAGVKVRAFMGADAGIELRYAMAGVTEPEFTANWATMLSWLKDECEPTGEPFTLRVKSSPQGYEKISDFCEKYLISDLRSRQDAFWFDHVERDGVLLLPRLAPYLGAMFVLSNVSRYEPELLAAPTRELTNIGYALTTFLDGAERHFPQLILRLLYGENVFFE